MPPEQLLLGNGLTVAIMLFVKVLKLGTGHFPVALVGQQVLLRRAEQGEQGLCDMNILMYGAVFALSLCAAGQLEADAVVQFAQPGFIACQPQYALSMGKVKRQFKGVAQISQHLMGRTVAIKLAVLVQVLFDSCMQGFIDQRQQGQLAGGVFSIDHQIPEGRSSLLQGNFVPGTFAAVLHLQGKAVERLQVGCGRVGRGQGSRLAEGIQVVLEQG